ncbi:hypothetical protein TB1_027115 [Malus domestica]
MCKFVDCVLIQGPSGLDSGRLMNDEHFLQEPSGLDPGRLMNDEHFLQGSSGLDLELVEVLQGPLGLNLEGGLHEERRGLS